ncbi:hypothetical protein BHM03_00021316 [Ensete ventricosum]|nr:hypothetical protein BHM03_00021316 [Ensete ventricosum]
MKSIELYFFGFLGGGIVGYRCRTPSARSSSPPSSVVSTFVPPLSSLFLCRSRLCRSSRSPLPSLTTGYCLLPPAPIADAAIVLLLCLLPTACRHCQLSATAATLSSNLPFLLAAAAAATHCLNLLPITTHRFTSPLPSRLPLPPPATAVPPLLFITVGPCFSPSSLLLTCRRCHPPLAARIHASVVGVAAPICRLQPHPVGAHPCFSHTATATSTSIVVAPSSAAAAPILPSSSPRYYLPLPPLPQSLLLAVATLPPPSSLLHPRLQSRPPHLLPSASIPPCCRSCLQPRPPHLLPSVATSILALPNYRQQPQPPLARPRCLSDPAAPTSSSLQDPIARRNPLSLLVVSISTTVAPSLRP